jgi:hypothetical protein
MGVGDPGQVKWTYELAIEGLYSYRAREVGSTPSKYRGRSSYISNGVVGSWETPVGEGKRRDPTGR